MTQAHYRQDGDIAIITMDNPPVNGLGFDLRGVKVGLPICGSNRSCNGESCTEAQSRYLPREPT